MPCKPEAAEPHFARTGRAGSAAGRGSVSVCMLGSCRGVLDTAGPRYGYEAPALATTLESREQHAPKSHPGYEDRTGEVGHGRRSSRRLTISSVRWDTRRSQRAGVDLGGLGARDCGYSGLCSEALGLVRLACGSPVFARL
jgi:hypothetical protein